MLNNSLSYYQEQKKKLTGKELLKPYTEEEILNYENECSIKLPVKFRNYLLTISRETFYAYWFTFKLYNNIESFFLYKDDYVFFGNPDDEIYKKLFDDKHEDDDEIINDPVYLEKVISLGFHLVYYIQILDGGCSDDIYLCVKGRHYGRTITTAYQGMGFSISKDL